MQVTHDFDLRFDRETFIGFHGERFAAMLTSPSIRERFDSALEEAVQLCQPVACYDTFPIEAFLHERLRLTNGVLIGGGPVVQVTGGAEEMVVAVCTVGVAVDERIKAYQAEKQSFKMMVLDEMASWAVDQVRQQLYENLAAAFWQRGRRTSAVLSPGESTWSVRDQRVIFDLLDAEAIGVSLSQSFVMNPLKSLTLVMGTGRQPMGVEGLTNCDFCSIQTHCRYRHRRG